MEYIHTWNVKGMLKLNGAMKPFQCCSLPAQGFLCVSLQQFNDSEAFTSLYGNIHPILLLQ